MPITSDILGYTHHDVLVVSPAPIPRRLLIKLITLFFYTGGSDYNYTQNSLKKDHNQQDKTLTLPKISILKLYNNAVF